MNQSCGEKSKEQLDAEFGEGNCTFIVCDVSNGDALKGNGGEGRRTRGRFPPPRQWGSCFREERRCTDAASRRTNRTMLTS